MLLRVQNCDISLDSLLNIGTVGDISVSFAVAVEKFGARFVALSLHVALPLHLFSYFRLDGV